MKAPTTPTKMTAEIRKMLKTSNMSVILSGGLIRMNR